jgi:ribose 5-phosphate isomerase A
MPDGLPEVLAAEVRTRYKQAAAERAADLVESGMVVGLGSGSTAIFAVRRIGALLREGALRDIVGVPTSRATQAEAHRLGIPLVGADWEGPIDLTIDGADEVDGALDLIKGAGGALLREKIVAQASRREVIVVDESKLGAALGSGAALPVEVTPFGWAAQARYLESLGARVRRRRGGPEGAAYLTEQGNFIFDCTFGPIDRPAALAAQLEARAGVVEHGLFLGVATDLIVAGRSGVTHRRRAANGSD